MFMFRGSLARKASAKRLVLAIGLLASLEASAVAEQQVASAVDNRAGRYLGNVVYNGSGIECTIFANPVLAVGPYFGPVMMNGWLVNAYYYQCYELRGGSPGPGPGPGPVPPPRPTDYTWGAIAYQTIPASWNSPATYRWGVSSNQSTGNRAANAAQDDCGNGCGYFTFYDSCAGISFYRHDTGNVANYGYFTRTEPFNGSNNARRRVERFLEDRCDQRGIICESTTVVCSND
jgi:hypothetical protein